jgi:hypothetical protein
MNATGITRFFRVDFDFGGLIFTSFHPKLGRYRIFIYLKIIVD